MGAYDCDCINNLEYDRRERKQTEQSRSTASTEQSTARSTDLIDRQEAIDRFNVIRPVDPKKDEYTKGIDVGIAMCIVAVKDQPSAQPEPIKINIEDFNKEDWERFKKERGNTPITVLPSAQPEIIRCKDCKHWRQQTNYQGAPLSFGFCESDDMWRSLYGETYEVSHIDTDDDFYCGHAERRTE